MRAAPRQRTTARGVRRKQPAGPQDANEIAHPKALAVEPAAPRERKTEPRKRSRPAKAEADAPTAEEISEAVTTLIDHVVPLAALETRPSKVTLNYSTYLVMRDYAAALYDAAVQRLHETANQAAHGLITACTKKKRLDRVIAAAIGTPIYEPLLRLAATAKYLAHIDSINTNIEYDEVALMSRAKRAYLW